MAQTYEQAKETFECLARAAWQRRDRDAQDARRLIAASGLILSAADEAAVEAAYAVVERANERYGRFVRLARRVLMVAPGHWVDDSAIYPSGA